MDPISEPSTSSEDSPDFSQINKFLKSRTHETMPEPPLNHPSREAAPVLDLESEEEDDLYRFVDPSEDGTRHPPMQKPRPSRAFNPAEDYDLWSDLCTLRANISVAQLIQVAPTLRKEFKEGATHVRKPRKPVMTAKIYASPLGDDGAMEIDVEILDKTIPRALIDGGSGINIMPLSTLEKL